MTPQVAVATKEDVMEAMYPGVIPLLANEDGPRLFIERR
jgi:hypothetical protein